MPKTREVEKISLTYDDTHVGVMRIPVLEFSSAFDVQNAQTLAAEILEEAEDEFPSQEVRSKKYDL